MPRDCYANETLERMTVTDSPKALTEAHWEAYHTTIVEPNSRPNRAYGGYAVTARKRKRAPPRSSRSSPKSKSACVAIGRP